MTGEAMRAYCRIGTFGEELYGYELRPQMVDKGTDAVRGHCGPSIR